MKKVLLGFALLAGLALLAVPTVAAPPLHKVTYGGWGITGNQPFIDYDVIGHEVNFGGVGMQAPDGTWRGQGSFVDRDMLLEAHLVVNDGTFSGTLIRLDGDADVYLSDVYQGNYPFILWVEQTPAGYQTYELRLSGPVQRDWWVSGIGSLAGGQIKIS